MKDMSNKEFIYGINSINDFLSHYTNRCIVLYVDKVRNNKRVSDLVDIAKKNNIAIEFCNSDDIDRYLNEGVGIESVNHQGVLLCCKANVAKDEDYIISLIKKNNEPPLILILDGVTDPHNLGACIRSANALGAIAVIVPKDKAVGLTPVVRKVASGAAEVTPLVIVKNLARFMRRLQELGIWIMGAAGEEQQLLCDLDLKGGIALVLGSEGSGLRRLTREHCDHLFAIPMTGTVESLNVSVATGICLYEAYRQRVEH